MQVLREHPISHLRPFLIFYFLCDVFDRLDLCRLGRTDGCLFGNPGIDEDERLADAFYIQRAMHYVLGNEDITGIIDFYDLIAESHFNIGIEVGEVFGIPDEVNPLVEGVFVSRVAQRIRFGDTGESHRQDGFGDIHGAQPGNHRLFNSVVYGFPGFQFNDIRFTYNIL